MLKLWLKEILFAIAGRYLFTLIHFRYVLIYIVL